MKLRKGVEFHNGKTFDANDAVASLNYHRGEASKSGAKSLLASVESIKADDAQHARQSSSRAATPTFPMC